MPDGGDDGVGSRNVDIRVVAMNERLLHTRGRGGGYD